MQRGKRERGAGVKRCRGSERGERIAGECRQVSVRRKRGHEVSRERLAESRHRYREAVRQQQSSSAADACMRYEAARKRLCFMLMLMRTNGEPGVVGKYEELQLDRREMMLFV